MYMCMFFMFFIKSSRNANLHRARVMHCQELFINPRAARRGNTHGGMSGDPCARVMHFQDSFFMYAIMKVSFLLVSEVSTSLYKGL